MMDPDPDHAADQLNVLSRRDKTLLLVEAYLGLGSWFAAVGAVLAAACVYLRSGNSAPWVVPLWFAGGAYALLTLQSGCLAEWHWDLRALRRNTVDE
jgi:hypothetical protein